MINRRSLLKFLAAGAGAALVPRHPLGGRAPQGEDHAREMLGPPEHEPVVQPERAARDRRDRHRHHRHRRRRLARPDPRSCRQPHRKESVRHRADLASHVHGSVLPARARKDPWPGRARHGAVGHQRKGAATSAVRPASRIRAQSRRVLRDNVQACRSDIGVGEEPVPRQQRASPAPAGAAAE